MATKKTRPKISARSQDAPAPLASLQAPLTANDVENGRDYRMKRESHVAADRQRNGANAQQNADCMKKCGNCKTR